VRAQHFYGGNGDFEKRVNSAIPAPVGLKFCILLEGDNTQNRVGANFKFPPLKNLAPLLILRLHYGLWDEKFQIGFTRVSIIVLG